MAQTNLGRILILDKGDYDVAIPYEKLDAVTKYGSSYLCKKACTGIDVTNTEYWSCIAHKGKDGEIHWNSFTDDEKADILSRINLDSLGFTNIGGFYVVDESGNVVIKYDTSGFDVAELSEHIKSLIKEIDGIGLSLGLTSGTAFAGDLGVKLTNRVKTIETIKEMLNVVNEDGFNVSDESGNVVIKYDTSGFDVAELSSHLVSLIKSIDGLGLEIGTVSGTAFDGAIGAQLSIAVNKLQTIVNKLTETDNAVAATDDDSFDVVDKQGNSIFRASASGIDFNSISDHAKDVLNAAGIGGISYDVVSEVSINI